MAVRRGVSRERWQMAQPGFCRGGREFARQFDTAGEAFKACTNGCYIAFWLERVGVDSRLLASLVPGDWWYLNGNPHRSHQAATSEQLAEYADILRARFCVDGTPKVQR